MEHGKRGKRGRRLGVQGTCGIRCRGIMANAANAADVWGSRDGAEFVGVLISVPVALVIKRAGYTHTRN